MSLDLSSHILSFLVFWPMLGALIVLAMPSSADREIKAVATFVTGISVIASAWLYFAFRDLPTGMHFVEKWDWIPSFNIQYFLGTDGLSISLILLTALVSFIACIASFGISKMVKGYFVLFLILNTGMMGAFASLDFFLFFVFWELMLLPMYFLIGIWGGPRREYAAIKFFIFTMAGSVLMLLGMIALYFASDRSWDMTHLAELGAAGKFTGGYWPYVWWGILIAFIVKVPSVPVHTWLPDAHVEAPTAASAILAGVMLKMGTYGFLRVSLPILPAGFHGWQTIIAVLAMISIVYGAAVAFAQTDLKKLVAYSSVSHMGFAMLGIAAATTIGINGAVAVSFSHGLISGMLFLMVGMVYDRTHTRQISELSGLAGQMPVIAGLLAFASIASMGLPGLSGFVGEFLSLLGAWQSSLAPWIVLVSSLGVLLGAAYMLWMMQRVILGQPSYIIADCQDATTREVLMVTPLVVLIVAIGLNWSLLLRFCDPAARVLAKLTGG